MGDSVAAHHAAGCMDPCDSPGGFCVLTCGSQLAFALTEKGLVSLRRSWNQQCFACVSPAGGGYTNTDPESRRIRVAPNEVRGRTKVKVVYVVLEAQYQASISAGVVWWGQVAVDISARMPAGLCEHACCHAT